MTNVCFMQRSAGNFIRAKMPGQESEQPVRAVDYRFGNWLAECCKISALGQLGDR
jgi:hypothetical protein